MASPVNDAYSVASGVPVWAGRYQNGQLSGAATLGDVATDGVMSGAAPLAVFSITRPRPYQIIQRDVTTGDIPISGTYTGTLSGAIEARFNGGAWATIVASPTGGTFSGTLSGQLVGQGTLSVRSVIDPASQASVGTVGVGDIYTVTGDSNHYGYADDAVQPISSNGLISVLFAEDGTWKPHTENNSKVGAFADPTGAIYGFTTPNPKGSYFGALATLILATGVPVAFVPCAIGSTTIDNWQPGLAGGGGPAGFNTNFALDVAGIRTRDACGKTGYVTTPHKAVLCELGTNGGGGGVQATYESLLNAMVDGWMTHHGAPTILCLAGPSYLSIAHPATQAVIDANVNALQGPNFAGAWSGTHYLSASEINVAAGRMFNALVALGFY